jgi:hypothetical protein
MRTNIRSLMTATFPKTMERAAIAKFLDAKTADRAEIVEPLGRAIAVGAAVALVAVIAMLMSMV